MSVCVCVCLCLCLCLCVFVCVRLCLYVLEDGGRLVLLTGLIITGLNIPLDLNQSPLDGTTTCGYCKDRLLDRHVLNDYSCHLWTPWGDRLLPKSVDEPANRAAHLGDSVQRCRYYTTQLGFLRGGIFPLGC